MSIWASGTPYEAYVGRWSRLVAHEFLPWLRVPSGSRWLDVGCVEVVGIDASDGFIAHARAHVPDERAAFQVADAQALPFEDGRFDVAVSGLVLNFIPDPARALAELARVTRPSGTVAVYVWDYAHGMALMRHFWDAAAALDPSAAALDEGVRFPICAPGPLERHFADAGLGDVAVRPIDVPTVFRDFDDYWSPFLGAQGPAPNYAMSLDARRREALRERIRAGLPVAADGVIRLTARAWAARGTVTAR
jgi:SAM-dependent methyltransferase